MSRMPPVALAIVGAFLLRIDTSAADANPIQLVIDSAKYEASGSKAILSIKVRNESSEPVSLLRPEPILFDKHFASSSAGYVGIGVRPFKLNIVKAGKCAKNDPPNRILKNSVKPVLLTKRNLAFIAPNSEQSLGSIEIDVDSVVFCNEAKYSFQISYDPSFALPTTEATAQIDAYIKARNMNPEAIKGLLPEDAKFLAETGFLPENAKLFSGSNAEPPSIERYIESVKLMGSINKLNLVSNTVPGKNPSTKANVSDASSNEGAKQKAKAAK